MKRKLWLVILGMVCVIALAACERNDKPDDKGKEESNDGFVDIWRKTKESVTKETEIGMESSVKEFEYDKYGNWTLVTAKEEGSDDRIYKSAYEYDDKGHLLKHWQENRATGEMILYDEHSYDESGRRTETFTYYANYYYGGDVDKMQYEYEYYDGGVDVKLYLWYTPGSVDQKVLEAEGKSRYLQKESDYCVSKRRLSDYSVNESKDTKTLELELLYNERGDCVKSYGLGSDGRTVITEYVYNDNGSLSGTIDTGDVLVYGQKGEFVPTDEEYDDKGRLLREFRYFYHSGGGGKTEKSKSEMTAYTYDDEDRVVEIVEYTLNRKTGEVKSVTSRTTYAYDKNGNLIRETTRDQNDKITYDAEYEWEKFHVAPESLIHDDYKAYWKENVRLGKKQRQWPKGITPPADRT